MLFSSRKTGKLERSFLDRPFSVANLLLAVFFAAILLCLLATTALAETVHADSSDSGWDGMSGLTWQETIDQREEGSSDNWDDYPLGGVTKPGFDIFNLGPWFLYTIYEGVEGACSGMIDVCESLFGFIQTTDSLTLEIDDASYLQVYSSVVTISERAIQPIAVGFLGLALVLELLQFSREVATNRGDHFHMAGSYVWILVKFGAIMTLIGHTTLITNAIYELFLMLTRFVMGLMSSVGIDEQGFSQFMIGLQEITYADWGRMFIMLIIALVLVVAVAMTVLRVMVLTVTRMFEIYVRAAFSGIPLVMLTNRSTRDGGLRYFKEFAGACLQATVLVVMIAFSGVIMNAVAILLAVPDGVGSFVGLVLNVLAPIAGVLGVNAVIGMSRDISNRILGA